MTKGKSLYIRFEKRDDFKARTQAALKARKPSVGEKNVILFNSVVDYQKFMSEQKIAILAAIISQKPLSIYQLAQVFERDFESVQRDCTALEVTGLKCRGLVTRMSGMQQLVRVRVTLLYNTKKNFIPR